MQLKLTIDVPTDADAVNLVSDLLVMTAASNRLRSAIANPTGVFSNSGIVRSPYTNDIVGMWELAPVEGAQE